MPLRAKLVRTPVTFGISGEKPHPSKRSSDGAPGMVGWATRLVKLHIATPIAATI